VRRERQARPQPIAAARHGVAYDIYRAESDRSVRGRLRLACCGVHPLICRPSHQPLTTLSRSLIEACSCGSPYGAHALYARTLHDCLATRRSVRVAGLSGLLMACCRRAKDRSMKVPTCPRMAAANPIVTILATKRNMR